MATVGDGFKIGCGIILALIAVPASCAMFGISSANYDHFQEKSAAASAAKSAQPAAAEATTTLSRDCNLRALPTTESDSVGFAPAGDYPHLATTDNWRKIRVGGKVGWVGCR